MATAFRRAAVPLSCYYAVTIALPLVNGAAQNGAAFIEHALVVLVTPPLLIALACLIHQLARRFLQVLRRMGSDSVDNSPVVDGWQSDC